MPSETEKQRKMMAVAAYNPSKLYKRNRGVLSMGKQKLRHYARALVKKKRKKT